MKASGVASNSFESIGSEQREAVGISRKYNLECSISKEFLTKIDSLQDAWHRMIQFRCKKTIELNGLVVYNKVADDILVDITLSDVNVTDVTQRTKLISDNETVVTFDEPITIPADTICSIKIRRQECMFTNIV